MTKAAEARESGPRVLRVATRVDEASVVDVITLGFGADPMARWSFRIPHVSDAFSRARQGVRRQGVRRRRRVLHRRLRRRGAVAAAWRGTGSRIARRA